MSYLNSKKQNDNYLCHTKAIKSDIYKALLENRVLRKIM